MKTLCLAKDDDDGDSDGDDVVADASNRSPYLKG